MHTPFTTPKLAVGPMLYLWDRPKMAEFYQAVAQSSADIVYLGESVCGKRRLSKLSDYRQWAQLLHEAGKQVVLSTLALIEAPSELQELKRYIDNGDFIVEANDIAAVQLCNEQRLPFVIGPAINIYNARSLQRLQQLGAVRWVMPVELSRDWLVALRQEMQQLAMPAIETELFSYGYLPLAYSARCFTARHLNRQKDQCELVCQDYPDGIRVASQEGQSVFTLNGIQTQSGQVYNLQPDVPSMAGLIDICRISAHSLDCLAWLPHFKQHQARADARQGSCNGYWHRIAGMHCINGD